MSLLDRVSRFIHDNNLIPSAETNVVVGLSGGADSVALLHILSRLGYRCVAAHCNFHLRGEESMRDAAFSRDFAISLGVTFRSVDFDTEAYCAMHRGLSLEMACRKLRYDWFETLVEEFAPAVVAVAHHADDNIETMMLNLIRGTGISGVRAMMPKNDTGVIRPLLSLTREEIEGYCVAESLSFVTDSTNRQCDFLRNKIRNLVLPQLYDAAPNARQGLVRSLALLSENYLFYRDALSEKMSRYVLDDSIDLVSLIDNERYPSLMLYDYLKPELSRQQCDDIVASPHRSGCRFGDYSLDRGVLRKFVEEEFPEIDEILAISTHEISEWANETKGSNVAYFDADKIDVASLSVRSWRHGDRLYPFGMKGSRKVSDIFSDSHIPVGRKASIPLLVSGNDILWVVGIRASRLYSITSATKRYIKVEAR